MATDIIHLHNSVISLAAGTISSPLIPPTQQ